jgi:hypothetical protein
VIISAAMMGKINSGKTGIACGDVGATNVAIMNASTMAGPTNGPGRPPPGGPPWGLRRSSDALRCWARGAAPQWS